MEAAPVNRVPYIRLLTFYISHRLNARFLSILEIERDGAVGCQLDVGDGFAHELATIGSGGEERVCWRRLVRKAIIDCKRLGVGVGIGRGAEIAAAQTVILCLQFTQNEKCLRIVSYNCSTRREYRQSAQ